MSLISHIKCVLIGRDSPDWVHVCELLDEMSSIQSLSVLTFGGRWRLYRTRQLILASTPRQVLPWKKEVLCVCVWVEGVAEEGVEGKEREREKVQREE